MIDDAPQSCSPIEYVALIVYLNYFDLLKESVFDATIASSLPLYMLPPGLCYVFGMAKSQAVSWAHFHMARTSRVKPMSLGFSSPRISRCFIMAMNSLLLSSPFPEEDGRGEE